jgi:hypothetical protein
MTGRAAGFCSGYSGPGYVNPGYGRGFGRGWSRGFGRGYWGRGRGFWWRGDYTEPYYRSIYPKPSKEEEKTHLEEMVKGLEEEIKDIRNRIQELSKEKRESP